MEDIREVKRRSVSVLIPNKNGDKILVLKHNKCKGLYILPAGTIEEGETVEQAAIREMKEELGIEIYNLETYIEETLRAYDRIDGIHIYKETCIFAKQYSGTLENLEPHKHPELKWIDMSDLGQLKTSPTTREAVLLYTLDEYM
ncbi:MAG: NUDIX hydrolase [Cetobacterium sp.]|uniref:NUDIX hydrolase n=1 Tax=Cetobacterium sp. TaxID=2071632 RepID=UPI003F2C9338